jgi:hypothetical protein
MHLVKGQQYRIFAMRQAPMLVSVVPNLTTSEVKTLKTCPGQESVLNTE